MRFNARRPPSTKTRNALNRSQAQHLADSAVRLVVGRAVRGPAVRGARVGEARARRRSALAELRLPHAACRHQLCRQVRNHLTQRLVLL